MLCASSAFAGWAMGRAPRPAAAVSQNPIIQDGLDPAFAGCNKQAVTLMAVDVRLSGPVDLGGHHFGTGESVGTVELRYSARCSAVWARFAPLNVLPPSAAVAVTVSVDRPSDGTATTWTVGRAVISFGDMLLTTRGCVWAAAQIQFTAQNIAASGQTACLMRP